MVLLLFSSGPNSLLHSAGSSVGNKMPKLASHLLESLSTWLLIILYSRWPTLLTWWLDLMNTKEVARPLNG